MYEGQHLYFIEKDRPAAQVQSPIQEAKVEQRRMHLPEERGHLAKTLPLLRRNAALQVALTAKTRLHLNLNP